MSASDTPLERKPEPSPRPRDLRYEWNGLYWTFKYIECDLNIHLTAKKEYGAVVVERGGASMSGRNSADPDSAAADVRRLVGYLRSYVFDRDADLSLDGIPF